MINIFLIISASLGAVLVLIILFQKTEGGSLGLGTQSSISGGMKAPKPKTSITKITYIIAFGFLFWCLAIAAFMNRNFAPEIDLENISNTIEIDENLTEKIPEVPLK
jgi:preprotein translocase subunit SecG|tara:strand:- start:400 stop:720 length:321 start_codon:yes stop_codon:yes gene_type:complete